MKTTAALALLGALAAGPALAAQTPIVAYGLLLKAPMASFCRDTATHYFDCSNLRLRPAQGASPNLGGLEGKWVRVTGTLDTSNPTPNCVMVDVAHASAVTERLEMGATVLLGNSLPFAIYGQPGTFAALLLSPYRTLLPLGAWGTFYLDLQGFLSAGTALITGAGSWTGAIPIPNDPVLQFMRFNFQAALVIPTPALTAVLANVSCLQIQ